MHLCRVGFRVTAKPHSFMFQGAVARMPVKAIYLQYPLLPYSYIAGSWKACGPVCTVEGYYEYTFFCGWAAYAGHV